MIRTLACLLAAAFLAAAPAHAHKPSDSYLSLAVDGATVTGQWDIALRDLDVAIGLDADRDDAITWGEVKAKQAAIAAYAFSRLALRSGDAPCAIAPGALLVDRHTDGAYAVLPFTATCATAPHSIAVEYRLLFDVDPQHRGLLNLAAGGTTRAGIFAAAAPLQSFPFDDASPLAQFADYLREGVVHIWTGFDHLLFLLSLLLPAVLVVAPGAGRRGVASFRDACGEVLKVVTAFTVAHSITLSLAALGVVMLPSRLVESAIAVSVVLAALNNVWPVVLGRRWVLAFVFGLVHGFGFASVLADLGLPQASLLPALVAFNVGVEIGQLAIVTLFLPLAFAVRDTRFYGRTVFVGGSLVVAAIAAAWFAERAFDLALLPGVGT
ncbi:MAG: HupE/UreJ family protein [Burkholderiales bacterium]